MHDFCLTYPYGFGVLLGGLLGYARKGSFMSWSGLLLLFAGYRSHQAYLHGSTSLAALFIETVVSLVLTVVMGERFLASFKFMPAGLVAGLSGIMALFYLYKDVVPATGAGRTFHPSPAMPGSSLVAGAMTSNR